MIPNIFTFDYEGWVHAYLFGQWWYSRNQLTNQVVFAEWVRP